MSSTGLHTVANWEVTLSSSAFNSPKALWLPGKEDWCLMILLLKLWGTPLHLKKKKKKIRVMRIFELSNWTRGSSVWHTPNDLLYLSLCLRQTLDPLSLIITAEYKVESVLCFATGIFFMLWMCKKEENFGWLDYLGMFYCLISSLQEYLEKSRHNSCETVISTKLVVPRNKWFP